MMTFNSILFNDFETLDIFGPVEIFGRNKEHTIGYYSLDGGKVVSAQGLEVRTKPMAQIEPQGIIVLPGGMGTRLLIQNAKFLQALREITALSKYCLSICTGAALLAKAGVLDGRKATSNKRAFDWVVAASSKVLWQKKARWVVDGKFYTASGVSAGIDMALGFISDLYGIEIARQNAKDIEYIWQEDKEQDLFVQ
jgi:putative intracellular protease/amidase